MKKKSPSLLLPSICIGFAISIATGFSGAALYESFHRQLPAPPTAQAQDDCFPMMDSDGVHTFCGTKSAPIE